MALFRCPPRQRAVFPAHVCDYLWRNGGWPVGERAAAHIAAHAARQRPPPEVRRFWGTSMLLRQSVRSGAIPVSKLLKLRKWLPGVLAAALGIGTAGWASAQAPAPPKPMPAPGMPGTIVPVPGKGANTPAEKTVTVNFTS